MIAASECARASVRVRVAVMVEGRGRWEEEQRNEEESGRVSMGCRVRLWAWQQNQTTNGFGERKQKGRIKIGGLKKVEGNRPKRRGRKLPPKIHRHVAPAMKTRLHFLPRIQLFILDRAHPVSLSLSLRFFVPFFSWQNGFSHHLSLRFLLIFVERAGLCQSL